MSELSTDEIDDAITKLVLSGPHGPEAGVTLARIAGRALKYLDTVVGRREALVTAETLIAQIRKGMI